VGLRHRVGLQPAQRLSRQIVQPLVAVIDLAQDLAAHIRCPETLDVVGNTGERLFALLRPKEIANIVGHLYQVLRAAHVQDISCVELSAL